MRCKSLRSILASLIILAFAISLLPTITANAGQSTPSTRRGKNGGAPGKAESPPIARNPQPAPASQADDRNASPDTSADAASLSGNGQALQSESAQTSDARKAQQSPP
ncbi:MAG TPA: hypothetical protein VIS78_11155, partial [Blastocatellia bacterium]